MSELAVHAQQYEAMRAAIARVEAHDEIAEWLAALGPAGCTRDAMALAVRAYYTMSRDVGPEIGTACIRRRAETKLLRLRRLALRRARIEADGKAAAEALRHFAGHRC